VREACKALLTLGVSLGVTDVRQVFNEIQDHRSRCVLLELVENMSRWSKPLILIPACSDDDEKTRERATALLSQWLTDSGRVGIQPSRDDLDRLRTTVERYGTGLTEEQASELDFMMRTIST
jgi:hypothetical protein